MTFFLRLLSFYTIQTSARKNGAEPDAGKFYRKWLHTAGMKSYEIQSNAITFASGERTQEWGETWAKRISETKLGDQAVEYGFSDRKGLQEMAAGWRAWSKHPDAMLLYIDVSAVIKV